MYDDNNWTPATGDELAGFLEQINPVDGRLRTNPAQTQVAWRALPFYDEVVLIRVRDASWTPRNINIYYLTMKGNLYRLNGTSPPIHEVNAQAPIKITEENVIEYLKFFCFFVRGEEGPFLIAESMEDADIPKNMDPQTKAVMEGVLRPATYEGKNEKGEFLCDGVVFYSNALFLANFSVQPGGMIEMLNDEPVAGELPIRVDAPVA